MTCWVPLVLQRVVQQELLGELHTKPLAIHKSAVYSSTKMENIGTSLMLKQLYQTRSLLKGNAICKIIKLYNDFLVLFFSQTKNLIYICTVI